MKKTTTALLAILLTASGAATAHATISHPPEGGTWDYGTNAVIVWSNYRNTTPSHSTSVDGAFGLEQSPCAGRGKWAKKDAIRKLIGNRSFYRNTCP